MKKCIYIVEDNEDIREIIEFILIEEDYKVKAYPTVDEFWMQMKKTLPDLVVLDIMLPDGNGLDICAKLKKENSTHNIPVIIMSANYQIQNLKASCQAEEFISKPFDIYNFVTKVHSYLN
jgi:DNA-binding response OmpR family regulator